MSDDQIWEGFVIPETDYFKVPNDFIEAMSRISSLAELKIILYVMRHTWGFQEYDTHKKITIDEFMSGRKLRTRERMDSGTGLSDTGVKEGTAKAIKDGFLECDVDDSDRGRVKKLYRIKLKNSGDDQGNTPPKAKRPSQHDRTQTSKERIAELQAMPYSEYLQTPEWAKKRIKALRFAQFRCQLCNSKENLNVHHRTYERIGCELLGDLITLCQECHVVFHQNRELAD